MAKTLWDRTLKTEHSDSLKGGVPAQKHFEIILLSPFFLRRGIHSHEHNIEKN
jgi:hypothetical protein